MTQPTTRPANMKTTDICFVDTDCAVEGCPEPSRSKGMCNPHLAFVDCETTSLRPDRRAWEIGIIARTAGHADVEHHWFIDADDLDLGNADLMSLKIGRFHERHPQYRPDDCRWDREDEADVMQQVEAVTRGAHLVGAVPNFDSEVLAARMRAHGICPSWHYHLADVETLAVGYLAGQGKPLPALPWNSDELALAVGVEPADDSERHTALGDARWAMRIWDKVTGGGQWTP